MKKAIIFIALLCLASICFASDDLGIQKDTKYLSDVIRYGIEKKEPAQAFMYSLAIPSFGHAYAGDWNKGVLFVLVELAEYYGMANSVLIHNDESGKEISKSPDYNRMSTFAILLAVTKIYECIDAYMSADSHNRQLREKYQIEN